MLLFVSLFGCGKKPVISDSGVRSDASVSMVSMLEGNYGIENSPDCNGNIEPIVNQGLGKIIDCHNAVLKVNPAATGTLTLEAKIVHGRVMSASTALNETGSSELSSCLEGAAKSWRFATACTAMTSVALDLKAKN